MSNGLMAAFVSVLSIAASSLAKTDRDRLMAVWLASHDQGVFGRGVVDFDISEYLWEPASFDQDKEFLLAVIRAARAQHQWSTLDYSPRLDWILECLARFEELVQLFLAEHVPPISEQAWSFGERVSAFERCAVHGIYLHRHGCVLCNDD